MVFIVCLTVLRIKSIENPQCFLEVIGEKKTIVNLLFYVKNFRGFPVSSLAALRTKCQKSNIIAQDGCDAETKCENAEVS